MKQITVLGILLTAIVWNCFGQDTTMHQPIVLKVQYETPVLSRPDVKEGLQIDTLKPGSLIYGLSIINASTYYGIIPYWHVYYEGQTAYIKDFLGNIDYNNDLRNMYVANGEDSVQERTIANKIISRIRLMGDSSISVGRTEKAEQTKRDSIYNHFKNKIIAKQKKAGLGIDHFFCSYPIHSNAVSVSLTVTNYSKETLKYIHFYLIAFDPVGERVTSMGKSIVQLKGIGPITTSNSGSYTFDHAFWSKLVGRIEISKIDVEYMNGAKKTITNVKDISEVYGNKPQYE